MRSAVSCLFNENSLFFSIVDYGDDSGIGTFRIDPFSGQLYLQHKLHYSKNQMYKYNILVSLYFQYRIGQKSVSEFYL